MSPNYFSKLLDENQAGDEMEVRAFGVYPLPTGSLTCLTELLTPYAPPRWPVWWPIWKFPNEEIQRAVNEKVQEVVSRSGPLSWSAVGDLSSHVVRALAVVAARAG